MNSLKEYSHALSNKKTLMIEAKFLFYFGFKSPKMGECFKFFF